MSPPGSRFPLVDALKALAAQLIVLHHLAWFGPMSDVVAAAFPLGAVIQSWLAEFGRYAVAVFLVVAGFLAAQSLLPGSPVDPLRLIGRRYLRLVGPFGVALALAIACAALARQWMVHDSIGAPPTLGQFALHLLLLHGLLGVESLSAGVWYIAIDFQLYGLLVVMMWIGGRLRCRTAGADFFGVGLIVAGLMLASLFYFNRDDAWDATALYFFGAYGLGIVAAWGLRMQRHWPCIALMAAVGVAALLVDFRPRLAVALATAMLLVAMVDRFPGNALAASLGRQSYALFLVHFPVCLVVNAGVTRLAPGDPLMNLLGLLLAWALSNLAAFYFHQHVELPIGRLERRKSMPPNALG